MGLWLTAERIVCTLVNTQDGTILADEVITLGSANETAAHRIQSFALDSQRAISSVRLTCSEDTGAHGSLLRTKLRLLGFETVEMVSEDAALESRNRTARVIAPHVELAYGAARADLNGDGRNKIARVVLRAPVAVAVAAGVIAVAGVGVYLLIGGLSSTAPITDANAATAPPLAAAPVPQPAVADPNTSDAEMAARGPDETPATVLVDVSVGAVPTGIQPTASEPQVAIVQDVPNDPAAPAAAAGITAGEPQTISTVVGEPHLTGSQLAAGPVQAVVSPIPVSSVTTPVTTAPATAGLSKGPLSVLLGALP